VKISTRRTLPVLVAALALAVSASAGERAQKQTPDVRVPTFIKVPPPSSLSTHTWVVQTRFEVIGVVFSTLPAPLVSFDITTTVGMDGADPADEAQATSLGRVTLTTTEARALGEKLIEFADDPQTIETLLLKLYE
jgi:hypothetical protein